MPLTGSAGFHSCVFVVSKCIGGYDPYSILNDFNHICTCLLFRSLLSERNLFNVMDMLGCQALLSRVIVPTG